MDPAEKFAREYNPQSGAQSVSPASSPPPTASRSVSPISETEAVPTDDKITNQGQWVKKKVLLLDGEFRYWEAKSGSSIFVDTTNLDNVNLLTPAIAQKLFPS
jgi:hypothetical protein